MNLIRLTTSFGTLLKSPRLPLNCQSFRRLQIADSWRSCTTTAATKPDPTPALDETRQTPSLAVTPTVSLSTPSSSDAVKPKRSTARSRLGHFVRTLCIALQCTPRSAQLVLVDQPDLVDHAANVEPVCRYLLAQRVSADAILANGFLLATPVVQLAAKVPLLLVQRPRDINDFVPLLRATTSRLQRIRKQAAREADFLPGGHRVYYLAGRLQLAPAVVAQHLSTHLFMFDLPIDQLIDNLDVQLRYNVAPINILRDPWAFRYSNRAIEARLDRAAGGHKDKLMPWMVRCPEEILAKSIQHSVDEKELLGDRTLVEYVAERLGFDTVTTKFILDKHLQIYTVRVTKIKEVLDYLLLESGYTANDVAQTPRILCHSLQTTRHRLEELRSLGCKPSSLVIVCRSANEYRKFIEAWTDRCEAQKRRDARLASTGAGDES